MPRFSARLPSERYRDAGTLYVVATPIGHLEDFTQRAIRTLQEVEVIYCEDTRRTGQLRSAYGIQGRLERFDAYASPKQIDEALKLLKAGSSAAFVTDAGTPGVSDPGAHLVRRALQEGIKVSPVPGASSVSAFVSIAGFKETTFIFRGFFPRERRERLEELAWVTRLAVSCGMVWLESPKRMSETADFLGSELPDLLPDLWMVAAKELTKIHEKIFSGSVSDVARQIRTEIEEVGELGEWIFGIEIKNLKENTQEDQTHCWNKALECLMACEVSVSLAVKTVSQTFGITKNQVYDTALEFQKKRNQKK